MHRDHDYPHHFHDGGGASNGHVAGAGHNHPAPNARVAQWQTPHREHDDPHDHSSVHDEPDLDLVETAFVEGFYDARDPTSFLRLAHVPFEAVAEDGAKLALLRVEVEALTDIGSVTPHLGGVSFHYDPLPAAMVSRRRRLHFIYFDGRKLRPLRLAEVRALGKD